QGVSGSGRIKRWTGPARRKAFRGSSSHQRPRPVSWVVQCSSCMRRKVSVPFSERGEQTMNSIAQGDHSVFKWTCLLVAVVALAGFGWMLNDMRLEVKRLAPKVEQLTDRSEDLVARLDKQLPPVLAHAERISTQLDSQLPRILAQTESAGKSVSTHLPGLLK